MRDLSNEKRLLPLGGVALVSLIACLSSCRGDGLTEPELPSEAGGFPRSVIIGVVELGLEFHPVPFAQAAPSSPTLSFTITLQAFTSYEQTFRYRFKGFRLYRGPDRIAEIEFPGTTTVEVALQPFAVIRHGEFSAFPDFFLSEGVPEGVSLMTALVEIAGEDTPIELLIGPVLIAPNNGLRTGGPDAPRRFVVMGRARTEHGLPVQNARVDVGIHWQDCRRPPFAVLVVFTNESGFYRTELTTEDRVPEACVSVVVSPSPELAHLPPVRAFAELNFDIPVINGVVADSVQVDVVLR